ncbi:MAG TPA: ABC transporter permease [Actinocrinis sp.]|jgi:D-xylose transport system permease protein|uniref:sugar ABC transporter permease n=1 Tax=Actinocrinis sp. TaxID=1920516 RepID=UPI002DDD3805|nr:ABC transporter permease [Actinocrinis sp.]HEV3174324.1 ABC transporter permease [Actinocrinis sp.]
MSAPTTTDIQSSGQDAQPTNLADYTQSYVQRVRSGETGSIPALLGLIVLVIFFVIVHQGFLSAYNVENIVADGAPTIVMAMGLVFVLLLGEIDLSAGTASGVCAALMAVMMARHGQPWWLTFLAAIGTGVVIGFFIGWLRAKVGIPSFVITLAAFLGFQGVTLILIGPAAIQLHDNILIGLEGGNNDFVPIWLGWTILAAFTAGYALLKVRTGAARRRNGLTPEPLSITALKVAALAAFGGAFIYYMGINRSLVAKSAFFAGSKSEGMPWVVVVILVLFVLLTFVLNRTRYGRHVYAVGGNDEASRRAGIRVDRIRISVFVICSTMAALAGILSASFTEGVQSDAGAGNTLLLAVGAAVIGGTSLFGGRGRVVDAVIGGLVVEVIAYGMSNLIQSSNSAAWQQIVTGLVLLIAAGFDAVSRRGSGAGSGSFARLLAVIFRLNKKTGA